MKGDIGVDVSCPLCGAVLHPRTWGYRSSEGVYYASARVIDRKAMAQHLLNTHPSLSVRERSLLCDSIVAVEG